MKTIFALFCLVLANCFAFAQPSYVSEKYQKGSFVLSSSGKAATLLISDNDYPGVLRAFKDLQKDIQAVTGVLPSLAMNNSSTRTVVIAGTLGRSTLIDQLVKDKKLNVADITDRWETAVMQVIEQPMPGIERALVIAGSDKRGTIFGIYDLSSQIGVSPWYWWADVPPKKSSNLYVLPTRHVQGEPAVQYRGIFLNDEEPSLGRWAVKNYEGFNHEFYGKLFELILRMKGNFLWPAMWWASFNSNDSLNAKLADEYGIVMSTSHHEPMMRAHAEWKTGNDGEWNYDTNAERLRTFWKEGIKRMGNKESIITLAMRGDGDKAMSANTNIALLEKIVADQRTIIHDVVGKKLQDVPQVWAIYKEVQDYYDQGMKVPDDITLLFCDDNWGNIRKLPKLTDAPRAGGYGIYYHFDYVGGPRNYKWLNTNPISKVYEQMHLANEYGANKIWVVNVGDLKPMEFPIEFFLDYAWNPKQWNADNLKEYTTRWAERQFGKQYAPEISRMLSLYTKFNSRRKPELLTPDTYSLIHYREAETVVKEYNQLASDAERLYAKIPMALKDAYYQLVLYPIIACANLNELYVSAGKNSLYASQGRAMANDMAEKVRALFNRDKEFSTYYNKTLSHGKWDNMMNQVHIGYTMWQDPKENVMPDVKPITLSDVAEMGVAIEGSSNWWPDSKQRALLPEFNSYVQESHYIDLFNRGKAVFNYIVTSDAPWVKLSSAKGAIEKEARIEVSIDWLKAPEGVHTASLTVHQKDGNAVVVQAKLNNNLSYPKHDAMRSFTIANGYIAMEGNHFSRAINGTEVTWQVLPDYGRTGSSVTPFPVTAKSVLPGSSNPHLEYDVHFPDADSVSVQLYLGPTLDYHGEGLKLAVSFDDEVPEVIDIHTDKSLKAWEKSVSDNVRIVTSRHIILTKGMHTLKYWMVDAGVVLEKIVIDGGGLQPSYLGPPERQSVIK